ncbi:MAG TPA: diaminopimelate dehydrogenase [Clostridiales bacterium]|nr:diaminopimelate dehydrogenase [Clostridiales bacterium]
MDRKIKIGIVGYGNLGKGVKAALTQNPDFELVAIFTRRNPEALQVDDVKVEHLSDIWNYKGKIDVMILCGGSANDLPEQTPMIAEGFNTVDSYDNHAKIPEHYQRVDEIAKKSGTVSLISVGWDPGLFSLNRLLGQAVLPQGKDYTFWGTGVSQGHSDAIRRVPGVKYGIQYTVPVEEAMERVRSGENPDLTAKERHRRVCYVVLEEGADSKQVESDIKNMPDYFAGYDTTVHVISEEAFKREHCTMPHGGFVIRTGNTGNGMKHRLEFGLTLEDNPGFTSSVLVAYARAVYRLSQEGKSGAYTIFDIPPGYLLPKSKEELIKELL